jgi:hypothetical protein
MWFKNNRAPRAQGVRRLGDYRKPRWWKRSVRSYWFIFVLLPFAVISAVLGALFLQGVTALAEILRYVVISSVLIAFAYYIRKTNSLKVWRTVWVLFGACGIGTLIAGVISVVFAKTLILYLGPGPSLLLTFVTAITVGALLGDYIGKRRDYRPFG